MMSVSGQSDRKVCPLSNPKDKHGNVIGKAAHVRGSHGDDRQMHHRVIASEQAPFSRMLPRVIGPKFCEFMSQVCEFMSQACRTEWPPFEAIETKGGTVAPSGNMRAYLERYQNGNAEIQAPPRE